MENQEVKVFTDEFINGVRESLSTLEEGMYITRDQICKKMCLSNEHANAISMLMSLGYLDKYESVRSRGIRVKKA